MKAKILGKTWDLSFRPQLEMGRLFGTCDHPSTRQKEIRILDSLTGSEVLDTVIHECLHASAHDVFSEGFVNTLAADLAKILCHPEVFLRVMDNDHLQTLFYEKFEVNREYSGEGKSGVAKDDAAPRKAPQVGPDQSEAVSGDGRPPERVG